jgi:hypothetical protein
MNPRLTHSIPLTELQRIKKWHVAHRGEHPLEYHLWDTVLTLWLMGWVGWSAFTGCLVGPAALCNGHTCSTLVRWLARNDISSIVSGDWVDCIR